jgi:Dolichyl-phosphate-mannose-protein mannosyltransferase
MNGVITLLALLIAGFILLFVPTLAAPFESIYGPVTVYSCAAALILGFITAGFTGLIIRRVKTDGSYLLKLFGLALLVRIIIGTAIFVFNGQGFFGGDALTYDFYGYQQLLGWHGDRFAQMLANQFLGQGMGSGWGMVYLVAGIYEIVGRNMLAVQFFNSVLGAVTAPIIYMCAWEVFSNKRVARIAAIAVAFYPSLVLWSSQGLKDGPIVFSLALCILATLRLGRKFSIPYVFVLVLSLFFVLALRFYVFYMITVAVAGAFVIGIQAVTAQSIARQVIIMIIVGLSLTYIGITRYANVQYEQYVTFDQLQRSRLDAASSANSGFGRDVDVSTTSGALSTIPLGLVYLLFAPFPWQLASLRQTLTVPEMIVWWASFPLLVLGLWFSVRHRLRQIFPILIFVSMLSLAYSVFQGNVGTAYRQRAQLLVFYFIFVAVGFVLIKEKREQRQLRVEAERETLRQREPAWATGERAGHAAGLVSE